MNKKICFNYILFCAPTVMNSETERLFFEKDNQMLIP